VQVQLLNIYVQFVYQGHRVKVKVNVKVKVTEAKKRDGLSCSRVFCLRLKGTFVAVGVVVVVVVVILKMREKIFVHFERKEGNPTK